MDVQSGESEEEVGNNNGSFSQENTKEFSPVVMLGISCESEGIMECGGLKADPATHISARSCEVTEQ